MSDIPENHWDVEKQVMGNVIFQGQRKINNSGEKSIESKCEAWRGTWEVEDMKGICHAL